LFVYPSGIGPFFFLPFRPIRPPPFPYVLPRFESFPRSLALVPQGFFDVLVVSPLVRSRGCSPRIGLLSVQNTSFCVCRLPPVLACAASCAPGPSAPMSRGILFGTQHPRRSPSFPYFPGVHRVRSSPSVLETFCCYCNHLCPRVKPPPRLPHRLRFPPPP